MFFSLHAMPPAYLISHLFYDYVSNLFLNLTLSSGHLLVLTQEFKARYFSGSTEVKGEERSNLCH
jgi:hypothetical protein